MAHASRSPRQILLPVICLVFVGSMIGLTVNLAKLAALAGAPPLAYLFWAVLGAGIVLTALAVGSGDPPVLRRRTIEYFLMSGLISIAVPNALAFSAVPHVGAGFVAVAFAFPPLLTYLLALAIRLERFIWLRAAGVLAGLAAIVILARSKAMAGDADIVWVLAALGMPVIVAFGNIYRTLRWPAGASSLSLAPGMLLGSAILLLPIAALVGVPLTFRADWSTILIILAQTATFAAMYVLYFVLQKLAGPVYLSQIGSVGAVIGTAIAVLALGEALPPSFGLVAALIVVGVVCVTAGAALGAARPPLAQRRA